MTERGSKTVDLEPCPYERIENDHNWYVAWSGATRDVTRSASLAARNNGSEQLIHFHGKDDNCRGSRHVMVVPE